MSVSPIKVIEQDGKYIASVVGLDAPTGDGDTDSEAVLNLASALGDEVINHRATIEAHLASIAALQDRHARLEQKHAEEIDAHLRTADRLREHRGMQKPEAIDAKALEAREHLTELHGAPNLANRT